MEQTNLITEELIIVGSRYGDLTDVLKPYYEKGIPIEPGNIKGITGSKVVYMQPVNNSKDPYAVGVFLPSEQRLGYVWKDQSYPLREWMENNNKKYHKAQIKRINTRHGIIIAETVLPFKLKDCTRKAMDVDQGWAKNIPETMSSITQQSLSLGFALLCDELPEAVEWNDSLRNRFENLNRNLPSDLSAQHIKESLDLYYKMRHSPIREVRESCDDMLNAYVSRGSEKSMRLWANEWLTSFFHDAAECDLLGLFEAANYTLERVEELLERAPENLFYLYKYNRERFAYHLYYSALPEEIYNRLLTLLAVREAMLAKRSGKDNEGLDAKVYRAIEVMRKEAELKHLYDFTWLMMAMNEDDELPSFDTPTSFSDYLNKIGIKKGIPNRSTISKYYDKARGKFPYWTFDDADATETNRRNNVGKRFLKLVKRE